MEKSLEKIANNLIKKYKLNEIKEFQLMKEVIVSKERQKREDEQKIEEIYNSAKTLNMVVNCSNPVYSYSRKESELTEKVRNLKEGVSILRRVKAELESKEPELEYKLLEKIEGLPRKEERLVLAAYLHKNQIVEICCQGDSGATLLGEYLSTENCPSCRKTAITISKLGLEGYIKPKGEWRYIPDETIDKVRKKL